MAQGLTDRSLVPLKPSDFKVIRGERRVSDVRAAARLAFDDEGLREIRRLTARWDSFLEAQSGKPCHRAAVSRARGPAGLAYWYTIPELIFIAGQSRAKNAPIVQYEAAVIAASWIEGKDIPDDAAPTLRALSEPDRPQVVSPVSEPISESQPSLFEQRDANHLGDPIEYDGATDTWYDPPLENRWPGPPLKEHPDRDSRGLPKTPPSSRGTYDASSAHLKAISGQMFGVCDCRACLKENRNDSNR